MDDDLSTGYCEQCGAPHLLEDLSHEDGEWICPSCSDADRMEEQLNGAQVFD